MNRGGPFGKQKQVANVLTACLIQLIQVNRDWKKREELLEMIKMSSLTKIMNCLATEDKDIAHIVVTIKELPSTKIKDRIRHEKIQI